MKKLQILGTGCPSCIKLEKLTTEVAKELGIEYEIDKITEIDKIMEFGVMMTPALAVNGEVKSVGKIPSADEIKIMIGK